MTGRLILIRHGESAFNAEDRIAGQMEVPLTEKGLQQARDAGKCLSEIVFDAAFSSTLSRAFNTAVLILENSGCNNHLKNPDGSWNVVQHADILEVHSGEFQGMKKNDPRVSEFRKTSKVSGPGGETVEQITERIKRFYDEQILPLLQQDKTVLVSCHAGTVRAFDLILGIAERAENPFAKRRGVHNGVPMVHEFEDGKLSKSYQITPPVPLAAGPGFIE